MLGISKNFFVSYLHCREALPSAFDNEHVGGESSAAILPVWLVSWKEETETDLPTAKFVGVGVGDCVPVSVSVGVNVGVGIGDSFAQRTKSVCGCVVIYRGDGDGTCRMNMGWECGSAGQFGDQSQT